MAARKNYFDSARESLIRVWKESPPGPEHKELDRLFSNGLINEADSANVIRLKYPIFSTFSARVFNAHFKKTKAKHYLMSKKFLLFEKFGIY